MVLFIFEGQGQAGLSHPLINFGIYLVISIGMVWLHLVRRIYCGLFCASQILVIQMEDKLWAFKILILLIRKKPTDKRLMDASNITQFAAAKWE